MLCSARLFRLSIHYWINLTLVRIGYSNNPSQLSWHSYSSLTRRTFPCTQASICQAVRVHWQPGCPLLWVHWECRQFCGYARKLFPKPFLQRNGLAPDLCDLPTKGYPPWWIALKTRVRGRFGTKDSTFFADAVDEDFPVNSADED